MIIRDGLRRMYEKREDIFYYITLGNENYPMPAKPAGADEGILKGLYKLKAAAGEKNWPRARILGSGSILREALRAQDILAEKFQVAADVWSATSYKELRRDALAAERWNLLHPGEKPRQPYVTRLFEKESGPVIAASDYMKIVPEQIGRWVPGGVYPLGTDGFGRSDTRDSLRRFFEVDAECIALATLTRLARDKAIRPAAIEKAVRHLGIDPDKADPMVS